MHSHRGVQSHSPLPSTLCSVASADVAAPSFTMAADGNMGEIAESCQG